MLKNGIIFLLLLQSIQLFGQEICDNAIDDDGDGLIDLNDTLDCDCEYYALTNIIPNPSFENFTSCPTTPFPSTVTLVNNWETNGNNAADYYNTCGMTSFATNTSPTTPLPGGGNGYAGGYSNNEYLGVCLNSPLLAGITYTLSLSVAYGGYNNIADVALFGTADCNDLGTGWSLTCPVGTGQWEPLDSSLGIVLNTNGNWQQITLTFTPTTNLNAISLGPTCNGNSLMVPNLSYLYYDDLNLSSGGSSVIIQDSLIKKGNWCTNDLVLDISTIVNNSTGPKQWYFEQIALIGETSDTIDVMAYGTGLYTLTYMDGVDCKRLDFLIDPPSYPTADFINASGNCLGDIFVFLNDTSTSSVDIEDWVWDMGDGTSYNSYNAFHTFTASGTFDVSLVVETELECTDTLTTQITVNPLPDPLFEFTSGGILYQPLQDDTIIVCGNDLINFNNLSTIQNPGLINQYNWDFGDLGTSTLINPSHQYINLGFYTINLSATSDAGCSEDFSCVIRIVDAPVANYSATDGCQNEPFTFTNNSTISSGSIVSHSWDFGDQNSSAVLSPVHLYSTDGSYITQLVVESDFGCMDSISFPVTVWVTPAADFQIAKHCLNETIEFIDLSVIATGNIISWDWDFDDNNASGQTNPIHNYSDIGNYDIELIVESDMGCLDTAVINHTIHPVPDVDFEIEDGCEGEQVDFINNSTISNGSITKFDWDFGNSTTSTLEDPISFSYADAGIYSIVLELESDQGCINSDSADLEIFETPFADILGDPMMGCSPFDAPMFNFVDNLVHTCVWDFGDGNIVTDCGSVRNTYAPGVYDVSVIVYSDNGCVDSVTEPNFVTVYESPYADFRFSPQTITTQQNEVRFENLTRGGAGYVWHFNDGSDISTDVNPVHEFPYQSGGVYSVVLEVSNDNSTCFDEIRKTIVVHDEVIFYIPNAFTPGDDNLNSVFLPVMTSGIDIYDYKLTIFNRWGEVLFISHNPDIGWNGTFQSAEIVQQGIYIWQVEYGVETKDERQTERGTVNLIR